MASSQIDADAITSAARTSVMADGVRVARDLPAVMRDGTVLCADVYWPPALGVYPVLLMRVPYGKRVAQSFAYMHPSWYARQGFVVVIQDVRGRFASAGAFEPLWNEALDGYDTVEWAARLSESNGRVGMYGFSYAGATQLLAASEQPPSLTCCVPAFTAADYYDGWMYEGGALNLAFVLQWTVQMLAAHEVTRGYPKLVQDAVRRRLRDFPALFWERPLSEFSVFADTGVAPYFFDWLNHDTRDEYWQSIGLPERYDQIVVPCLHIGGWFDVFSAGTVRNYTELARRADRDPRREQKLIMGPWVHMPWAPEASGPLLGESFPGRVDLAQLNWLNRWLRGEGPTTEPAVSYFVMGENSWRSAGGWPPGGQATTWFLGSGGRANSRSGDGVLSVDPPVGDSPPDVMISDPANPVPSAGGRSCCDSSVSPMGQACQAPVEVRNDVLLYTSEPLANERVVTGSPRVTLFVASTTVDVDIVARLVDVDPDGYAVNVSQGIRRARFRESLSVPVPLQPNVITPINVVLHPTSWTFQPAHRIRLQVTCSDFPATDPNLHTGGSQTHDDTGVGTVAVVNLFHNDAYRSLLRVPVDLSRAADRQNPS